MNTKKAIITVLCLEGWAVYPQINHIGSNKTSTKIQNTQTLERLTL